ncbi:hypothetical protein GCM10009092_28300 [Bowmanella denitrificans]|uniref:Uncharacterized protein n=1 Tax=Bowmanella denitrificans TaxID=366582 RepID=A0ABP3H5E5_9ALTE
MSPLQRLSQKVAKFIGNWIIALQLIENQIVIIRQNAQVDSYGTPPRKAEAQKVQEHYSVWKAIEQL